MFHVYKFCKLIFRGRPSRNIHRIVSDIRNESKRESLPHTRQQSIHERVELDSHANTTVLGLNCVVLAYTGKECEVSPYADKYDAIRNVLIPRLVHQFSLSLMKPSGWGTDCITHSLIQTNCSPTE